MYRRRVCGGVHRDHRRRHLDRPPSYKVGGVSGRHVLLVCSNDTHVRMFAPVVTALARRKASTTMVTLDAFYGQGANRAADELGLAATTLQRPGGPLTGRHFYRRRTTAIWRDVLASKKGVDRILDEAGPDALVVGNDFGLIEKLFLERASRLPAKTILVQDGKLAAHRPRERSIESSLLRGAKRVFSPLLSAAGLRYLAASEYGEWGADTMCATGERGYQLLRARAGAGSEVITTGQPRYDALGTLIPLAQSRAREGSVVTMLTTPFSMSGLGDEPQRRQDELVVQLEQELTATNRVLWVKPHPRESEERYRRLCRRPATRIQTGDAGETLARSDAAVIGISTVIEEAGLLGCPVVVPGSLVHGSRFAEHLPDPATYPRFESAQEAVETLDRVFNAQLPLAEQQSAQVRHQVQFDLGRPAADAVANALLR
jgi:hypothetical protein